jgi:hypothetical protein
MKHHIAFAIAALTLMSGQIQAADQFLAQVVKEGAFVSLYRDGRKFSMPISIRPEEEKIIRELNPDDDVIINGHVLMDKTVVGEGIEQQTVFVINKVRPVSLRRLVPQFVDDPRQENKPYALPKGYEPLLIPVSSGVATAMTLTVSGALAHSLAQTADGGSLRNEMNASVILGAGILMTGAFQIDEFFFNNKKDF